MKRQWVPGMLAVVAFVVASQLSSYFLDARYLLDSSTLYIETALLALGMTLVIISGNIDLSIGSTMALVAVLSTMMLSAGLSIAVVIPVSLALGVGLGLINGGLVAHAGLPSFMVTIGTLALYRGIAHALVGSKSATVPAELIGIDFVYLPGTPVPISLVLLLAFSAVVAWLLRKTVLGRWIVATGTNEKASHFSGVPIASVKLWVFALSGLMAGLASLHMASRLGVARYDAARGIEVDVITAVVLGGTAITGGRGTILGTMLSLLLLAIIRTGMGVANVKAEYQLAIIGSLLIATVLVGNVFERYSVHKVSNT